MSSFSDKYCIGLCFYLLEFDDHKTKEANFAYQCDKLECDIQSKLYDQEGCVDLNYQEGNATAKNVKFIKLTAEGQAYDHDAAVAEDEAAAKADAE